MLSCTTWVSGMNFFSHLCLFLFPGSETTPEPITIDHSFNDQDSIPNELESADIKPSEMALPLPIGTDDHQVLLPVTDSQSLPSDTLLRSSITGYSEPQFIFLQQLYWHYGDNDSSSSKSLFSHMNVIVQAVTELEFILVLSRGA